MTSHLTMGSVLSLPELQQGPPMSIRLKLVSLALIALAGLILVAAVASLLLAQLRVGGPVFRAIKDSDLLMADILPPPAYIVEAHLVVHEIASRPDAEGVARAAERLHVLRGDLEKSHATWAERLPPGEMRSQYLDKVVPPARDYFAAVEGEYLPLLPSSPERARAVRDQRLIPLYEANRQGVDGLVAMTTAASARIEAAAGASVRTGTLVMAVAVLACLLAIAVAMWWIGAGILRSLADTTTAMGRIASGDLSVRLDAGSADETGRMAASLNTMVVTLGSHRSTALESSTALGACATQLASSCEELTAVVKDTAAQTAAVAEAAQLISVGVKSTASAAEQLSASISQIATSSEQTAQIATATRESSLRANQVVVQLEARCSEVDSVLGAISAIAQKTNLLALNASIEAASAGEAGRGFAVVANEVKELAGQAAAATVDIGRRIKAIQEGSAAARAALEEICGSICTMGDMQQSVSAAVQEQSATTGSISGAIGEIAKGSSGIAANIASVSQANQTVSLAVEHISQTSAELARLAEGLQRTVGAHGRSG